MKNKVSLLRASVPCAKECSTFLVVGGRLLEYHILLFHRVRKLFYIFLFLQNKFLNYLNNCCNIRKLFYITNNKK